MTKQDKIDKALMRAKAQLGKYVQLCSTSGCKYNLIQSGSIACRTPNPAAEADDIKNGDAEDGHPLWNFYCMRFVRTAYGVPSEYPKAENMYRALKQKGAINTDNGIPAGALVFWHWTSFGHIGIYTGDGKVVHTGVNPQLKRKGIRESPLQEITEVMDEYNKIGGQIPSYLGWAHPPENWLA